jgi:hypothetical protein
LVVDDAAHLALEIGLDRQDIAPVALDNDRLLEDAGAALGVDELVELVHEAVVGGANLDADLAQGGAGAVEDVAFVVEDAVDFGFDALEDGDAGGESD